MQSQYLRAKPLRVARALSTVAALSVTLSATPSLAEAPRVTAAPSATIAPIPPSNITPVPPSSPSVAPVQLTRPAPVSLGLRTTSIILLSVGAAAFGTSIFLGLESIDKRDAANDLCRGTLCEARGYELRSAANDFRNAATVTMAIGGGLLLAGGLLLILGPSKPALPRFDGTQAGVRIVPGLGRVDLKGSF